jgi:O-antigen/teichoic acid export membrane protein
VSTDLRHTAELVAGAIVTALLSFAYTLGVGRMLGPAGYADFSAALSMLYFLAVAVSPLMPTTARLVTRYRIRGEEQRIAALEQAVLRKVLRWSAYASVPLIIAVVPLSRLFRFASPAPLALAFAAAVIYATVSIRRGVLQGRSRFREQVLNTVIEAALRLAGAIAILYFVKSATAALIGYVGALLIADALLRHRGSSDATVEWPEVWKLAKPMLIAMAGVAVYQNADVLAVKRWFSATDAGNYGAASTLVRSISVLFVPIYTVAGTRLTDLHERGKGLRKATLGFCAYFIALAAVPALIFAFAGPPVVALLYGKTFAPAGELIVRLAGVPLLTYTSLMIGQALITVHDRSFGPLYLGFAVLQVAALVVMHQSTSAIIASLYVVQGALLIAMLIALARLKAERQPC